MQINKLLITAGFAIGATLISSVGAQTGTAVVGTAPRVAAAVKSIKITATITAIDKKTRDITLKGPRGNEVTLTAGPAVKNFDATKVGDQVKAEYMESLTLELKKGGGLIAQRTEKAGVAAAKPGQPPAAAGGRQVTIVADVVGVDAAKQTISLKVPQRTVDLEIANPDQFKRIAKGDQVEATYTQAVALAVEPVAK